MGTCRCGGMADTLVLGTSARESVQVQVLWPVQVGSNTHNLWQGLCGGKLIVPALDSPRPLNEPLIPYL